MSSRLIILPKKSYCPWKPENVQRVLRDQERHRREVEEEAAGGDRAASTEREQEEQRARLIALSQRHQHQQQHQRTIHDGTGGEDGEADGGTGSGGGLRHFNLFEAEEQRERSWRIEHEQRWTMLDAESSGAPPTSPAEVTMPAPPNHREPGRTTRRPFYLRDNPYSSTSTSATLQERSEAFVAREERRKAELDPMAAFVDAFESDSFKKRKRRTGAAGAAVAGSIVESRGVTSTALVVRRRASVRVNDDRSGTSSSSQSESRDAKRHRRKEKRKRKSKKRTHREDRIEKVRRRSAEGLERNSTVANAKGSEEENAGQK